MSARVPVYDSGMLVALADRKAKAVALHEGLRTVPHRALVLGPVLAQVWRPRPALVHALSGVLKDCTVPQARTSEPPMREAKAGRPECLAARRARISRTGDASARHWGRRPCRRKSGRMRWTPG
ncbi:hypothetical protein ACWEQU_25195 [Streptomyces nodosus]